MKQTLYKARKTIVFSVLMFLAFFAVCMRETYAATYRTDAQMKKQYGTYYFISTLTKIKYSKGIISITSRITPNGFKILSNKKRTYRLAKTMKEFYREGDIPWQYKGRRSRHDFLVWLKRFKKTHFPAIHFWVRNGKIIAYAVTA